MTSHSHKPQLHGGDLAAARQRFPNAPQPWIDLSTGINPVAYPIDAIAGDVWARLPQKSDEDLLLSAATSYFGARNPGQIVMAPGTQALIQLLPMVLDDRKKSIAIVAPTYAEHALSWRRAGHDVFEARELKDCEDADVIVVVNPNNPTGQLYSTTELNACVRGLEARDGLLVVDEAFVDFLPDHCSIVPVLPPSTIVLRSVGKAFGLAGLRLGFAIGEIRIVETLRHMLGPWAVSGPALTVGSRALADKEWKRETQRLLDHDSARLRSLLVDAGLTIVGGTPLFQLARHDNAQRICEALGHRGILVRDFPYEKAWLRFGLPGNESAWTRLEVALVSAVER